MKIRRKTVAHAGLVLTTDMMMGFAGCVLACAATSFGIFMTVRGPSPDFGKGHDFTVFAQLAPRARDTIADARLDEGSTPRAVREAVPPSRDDLDTTPTASIPAKPIIPSRDVAEDVARAPAAADPAQGSAETSSMVIDSASVEVATEKAATLLIDGRVHTVRVGDNLPRAGTVMAITPGLHPSVKTTRGMILSRDD